MYDESSAEPLHYYLSDVQFSTVAIIDKSANVIECASYDATSGGGEAQHHRLADLDGSGAVDGADLSNLLTNWGSCPGCAADLDRDGSVGASDQSIVLSSYGGASKGKLTEIAAGGGAGPGGNIFGYANYVFNSEVISGGGGMYTVRFRYYDVAVGRWLERDPAGYVDSMSLYAYGPGNPVIGMDPYGLDALDTGIEFIWGLTDTITFGLNRKVAHAFYGDDIYIDEYSDAANAGRFVGAVAGAATGVGFIRSAGKAILTLRKNGSILKVVLIETGMGQIPLLVGVDGKIIVLSGAMAGALIYGKGVFDYGGVAMQMGPGKKPPPTNPIPGRPLSGKGAWDELVYRLQRYHGVTPADASRRLHLIKEKNGFGPADDMIFGKNGDVFHPSTGDKPLGNLCVEGG